MQWEDLLTFRAVAIDLSFTKAAQRLHISKPVVSARVKRLERNLGVRLLLRDTRNVTLTELGKRFLVRVDAVTESLERAREEITGADVGTGRPVLRSLLLGTTTPEMAELLAQADDSFAVAVRWTADSLEAWADLQAGRADVIIHSRWEAGRPAAGQPEPLVREVPIAASRAEVGLAARHRLARRGSVPLRELSTMDWIAPPSLEERESATHAVAAVAGFAPRFSHRPVSHDEALALQRFGEVATLTTADERPVAGVTHLAVEDDLTLRTYLAWHTGSSSAPRCDALADLLADGVSA